MHLTMFLIGAALAQATADKTTITINADDSTISVHAKGQEQIHVKGFASCDGMQYVVQIGQEEVMILYVDDSLWLINDKRSLMLKTKKQDGIVHYLLPIHP